MARHFGQRVPVSFYGSTWPTSPCPTFHLWFQWKLQLSKVTALQTPLSRSAKQRSRLPPAGWTHSGFSLAPTSALCRSHFTVSRRSTDHYHYQAVFPRQKDVALTVYQCITAITRRGKKKKNFSKAKNTHRFFFCFCFFLLVFEIYIFANASETGYFVASASSVHISVNGLCALTRLS